MSQVATVDAQALAPLLAQHEAIIARGLQSFVEVGEALAAIRDQRLYRATCTSFDAYLAERWPELGHRNYVHKMIRAARVAAELGTTVPMAAPASEWQVRPLLKLKTPEERREAWTMAAESTAVSMRPVTARDVEAAVEQLLPPPPNARPKPEPAHMVRCTLHSVDYPVLTSCPECRRGPKTHPADAIRAALAELHAHAEALAALQERLAALPFVELWDTLGEVTQCAALDDTAALRTIAATVEDLIGDAENAQAAPYP